MLTCGRTHACTVSTRARTHTHTHTHTHLTFSIHRKPASLREEGTGTGMGAKAEVMATRLVSSSFRLVKVRVVSASAGVGDWVQQVRKREAVC